MVAIIGLCASQLISTAHDRPYGDVDSTVELLITENAGGADGRAQDGRGQDKA